MDYSVPEAILKLRQGVGRLIRSGRDEGITVILDNRVLTKRYGRAFLNALPGAPVEIVDHADRVRREVGAHATPCAQVLLGDIPDALDRSSHSVLPNARRGAVRA